MTRTRHEEGAVPEGTRDLMACLPRTGVPGSHITCLRHWGLSSGLVLARQNAVVERHAIDGNL
jgi:hypothetical protein